MKAKYLFLLTCFIGVYTSCNMTDLTPLDSLTDASYWRSVEDLDKYAKGFYGNLSAPNSSMDLQSDDRVNGSYNAWLFNEITLPSSASAAGWSWENIRNLNFFMTRYKQVDAPEAEVNKHVGVIRFFRAMDYFGKIKTFGDVPWYDKDLQTNDTEELYKARDSRDFVLNKVIEDLEFAIQWLPEKSAALSGELHKDCARTLLSRICLYYGTYKKYHNISTAPTSTDLLKKAAAVSLDIINTHRYAIVKGDDAGCGQDHFDGYPLYYSNQFTQEDLTTNAECILARIYVADVVTHEIGRSGGPGFSKDFAESFLCKDGLPIGNSNQYKGDETLDNEMANRDPRMYQLMDNVHKPYNVLKDGTRQITESAMDGHKGESAPDPSANASVTGYSCVKFHSADPLQAEASKSTFDWFIYRYAEVLLNYAEAKYELGECTQEVLDMTINQLRDRVEMPHLTVSPAADNNPVNYGYAIEPLLYEIRRERRIELAAEGFRYDDIIRWNAVKLFENPKTFLGMRVTDKVIALYKDGTFGGDRGRQLVEYNGKQYIRPYAKDLNDAGRKWVIGNADNLNRDRRYLSPLPTTEIATINPNLTQNPGWETE